MATRITPPPPEPIKKSAPVTQSERILFKLKEAGPAGVPNYELAMYNLGYRGRITELRHDGYNIYCKHLSVPGRRSGVWMYYLDESDADISHEE